jgi:hypothetical protein
MAKEEPSLFWIVVDVVFIIADVSAAKNAIRAMRGPAEVLLEGGSVAEFSNQARSLAPEAADRLIASAEKKVATRELAGGIKAVAEGAAEGEGVLAHAFTEEGHELEVTAEGIARCSPKCPLVRDTFAEELAENPKAQEDLARAESLARTDPEAAARAASIAERELVAQSLARAVGAEVMARLEKLGINAEGLRRILAKGTDLGNVKGRLFDEIFAAQATKQAATAAGKEALAGGKRLAPEIVEKLEFIPGSSITDTAGEDLTDGILGWREGNKLHVVNIFEAKSAQRVATQLRLIEERMSRIPAKDLEEVEKYAGELFEQLSAKAAKAGVPLKTTAKEIEGDLLKYRTQKQLGGQVRETIERLDVNVSIESDLNVPAKIKVNGETLEVVDVSGSSRVTGVVPSDVKTAGITKALTTPLKKGGEGLNFGVLQVAMTQSEVEDIAKAISNAAKLAAKAE